MELAFRVCREMSKFIFKRWVLKKDEAIVILLVPFRNIWVRFMVKGTDHRPLSQEQKEKTVMPSSFSRNFSQVVKVELELKRFLLRDQLKLLMLLHKNLVRS